MTFHGQWNPPVDEVLFRNYFPGPGIGTFMECGAGDGITDSSCLFFEEHGWFGVNIEPCVDMYKKLQKNRPKSCNLNLGLSERFGPHSCFAVMENDLEVGVMVKHEPWLDHLMQKGFTSRKSIVEMTTYERLVRQTNIESLNLFVLDVEGHELQVIKGMISSRILPDVICAEYSFVGLKKLRATLQELDYRFDFHSFNNAFFSRRRDIIPCWGATPLMETT